MQIRYDARHAPLHQCGQSPLPHIDRRLSVFDDASQYQRRLGIVEVECQQEGLFHDGQVGSGQQAGERIRPADGPGDVLAPAKGVVGADQEIATGLVICRFEQ